MITYEVVGPQEDGLYWLGCFEGRRFYILDKFTSQALAQAMANKLNSEARNGG